MNAIKLHNCNGMLEFLGSYLYLYRKLVTEKLEMIKVEEAYLYL